MRERRAVGGVMTGIIAWVDEHLAGDDLDRALVERVVALALEGEGFGPAELAVRIVDDATCLELHGQHFSDPSITDVMTFPDGETNPETGARRLGDLAVCIGTARREAAARNRPVAHELVLYVLHGLLHILGHDDVDDTDRATMWGEQVRILAAVGIAIEPEPS
jgi:probable rRNA maturation factor